MPKYPTIVAELKGLGKALAEARTRHGLTQRELALQAGIAQPRLSGIEQGKILPTLPQLIRLSQVLVVPLQWFLTGRLRPGTEVRDLAFHLHWLGIVDLLIPDAVVPGAFRPNEEVLAILVRSNHPNPRIIEALPAVLAWNGWSASRLREQCGPRSGRATVRLAWLADVALTIHSTMGFPGGCPQRKQLERFVARQSKRLPLRPDDLGRPGKEEELPPVSKRWKISYDAPLSAFVERAKHLHALTERRHLSQDTATEQGNE